ncbi:antibiotic biosynthesis monooxygenase family protein [Herbidospora sp. RD11066]
MASVVKINVLTIPADMRADLEKRFAGRAGMVESADGFEWFELLRPVDGTDKYLVYTRWRSEEDFQKWSAQGHGQGQAEVWTFDVVQSAGPA